MHGLGQDRRWQSSKSCQEATTDASRFFCKGYFDLKAEAARAREGQKLEERIAELKNESRHLEDQGAGREADNQAAAITGNAVKRMPGASMKQIASSVPRRVPRLGRS